MSFRCLAAAGFFCIDASVRAATILDPSEAPVTDQQYRDLGATYSSVGEVSGPGLSGSGTYIGGRWVLTAGHIAFAKSSGNFSLGGSSYSIIRAITAPGWSFGADSNDIGLVELSSEIPGVAPASMIHLPDDSILLGQTTTWVGYGQGGTGLTGGTGVPGTLRGFTNVIDAFGPTFGLVESSMITDFDRPDGSKNSIVDSNPLPTALEGNVAPGDSGGAVFWDGGLVGVISYRARIAGDPSSNSDYGELSGASRLSRFTDWITEQTNIAAVPEPSVAILLAIGSIGWLRRRRS
jgi:secreted trypsin-like serine protease